MLVMFMGLGLGLNGRRSGGGGAPAVPADFIITNDAEWSTFAARPASEMSGKIAELNGTFSRLALAGKAPASVLTIRTASGTTAPGIDLTGTCSNITFSCAFQMTGWPKSAAQIVYFNSGAYDNIWFVGSSFRHGYGAGLADFDVGATYDEYARIDNVQTATTSTTTYALTWEDPVMTGGFIDFFNRGANTVYFTVGGAGVTTSTGTGTAVAAGARSRTPTLNPTTDTHIAIITAAGTSQINARAEIGMAEYLANAFAAGGAAVIGDFRVIGCTFRDVSNAMKGIGKPTIGVVMDNDFDRIYQDIVAITPAPGGVAYVMRNLLCVPFSRSGIAENLFGDARDPHGDLFQMFSDASGTIGPVYSGGNRCRRRALRTGATAQGLFWSDNDFDPSYSGVYSISDMLLGGSTNGINSGEATFPVGDMFVYGATVLDTTDLASGTCTVRLNTDGNHYVTVQGTIAQNFTEDDQPFVRENCLQLNAAASPAAVFPNIASLTTASTRAELETALTTAAEGVGLGAVATANAIDWSTSDPTTVILWANVPSGAAWADLPGQTIGATVTLPLRKILNRRTSQTVSVGSGVEWRSVATDGTTEVQAWTASGGTIDPDQFIQIRKAASASPTTAVDFDVTINGFLSRTVVTTTSAAPAIYWAQGATGPYFVDPATVPANTTKIEFACNFYIPTAATITASYLFTQESTGFDVRLSPSNGGQVDLLKIEDGTGAQMLGVTAMATNLPRDTWLTLTCEADQVAQTFVWTLTGYPGATVPFAASSNGVFQISREISFLGTTLGASIVASSIQFEYVEAYFTTSGTRSLRKRIEGDAAAVNADAWKLGGNAT